MSLIWVPGGCDFSGVSALSIIDVQAAEKKGEEGVPLIIKDVLSKIEENGYEDP